MTTSFSYRFSERVKDPTTEFTILKTLGKGSFGAVYHAREAATGIEIAIKKLTVVQENDLRDTIKEIEIMKACESDYIVRYYDNFFKKDEIWIIMEYCAYGSLTDILTARKRVFSEPLIAVTADAVLRGLVYLHKKKKIHRDVKCQNILVGDAGVPKLADFGIAGQLGGDKTRTDTMIGTPYFLAPEIIVNEAGYNEKVDCWALGISCIQLAEMAPPHADVNPMRALLLITTSEPPTLKSRDKWSPAFHNFLARALTKEPADRPSAAALLTDPFCAANPDPNAMRDYCASAGAGVVRMKSSRATANARQVEAAVAAAAASQLVSSSDRSPRQDSDNDDNDDNDDTNNNNNNNKNRRTNKSSAASALAAAAAPNHRRTNSASSNSSTVKSKSNKSSSNKTSKSSKNKTPRSSHKDDDGSGGSHRNGSHAASSVRGSGGDDGDDDDDDNGGEDVEKPSALRLQRAVTDVNGARGPVHHTRSGSAADVVSSTKQQQQQRGSAHAAPARSVSAFAASVPPPVPPPLSVLSGMPVCVSCGAPIDGKHMVVGESRWHKHHFRCTVCDELLAKDGFVHKDGKLFCKPHYHEKYSPICGGCGERITSGGYASALGQAWHAEHLVCAACRQPFKSGRFIAKQNRPFCDKQCHADFLKAHGGDVPPAAAAAGGVVAGSGARKNRAASVASGLASTSTSTSAASTSAIPPAVSLRASSSEIEADRFSEHLNRFAFFKKFYLEICTEAGALADAQFVAYVDSCVALRRKVSVLRLGDDVTSVPWTPAALMLAARAVVKASTFSAPQAVQFSENMAISTLDLSSASLAAEHVDALVTLLGCSFPLRELLFRNNPALGKRALSELAEALTRRRSLQRLDLSNCGVTDKCLQHVLGELMKIKCDYAALDVSFNQLTPAAAAIVGEFANSNAALLELRLSGNKLGDKGVLELVKRLALPQHTSLRVLTLSDTGLKRGVELAQWINDNAKHRSSLGADCLFLAELDVSNNALDADFAQFAGQLIATPACPSTLNVAVNKFNAKASKLLVDGLASPKSTARDLSLGGCELGDAAMAVLCDALRGPTPPIARLSIRNCDVTPLGFQYLAKVLKSGAGRLVELDIAFNKLAAESAEELAAAIVSGNMLDELNVAACHLGKKSLAPLCKLVRHSASLTKLHIDGNDWAPAQLAELATALEFNTRLEVLTLRNIGVGVKELVDFVCSLSDSLTLRQLKLEQNGLEKAPQTFFDKLSRFKFTAVTYK